MEPASQNIIRDLDKELDQLVIERNYLKFINDGIQKDELPKKGNQLITRISETLQDIRRLSEQMGHSRTAVDSFYKIEGSSSDDE